MDVNSQLTSAFEQKVLDILIEKGLIPSEENSGSGSEEEEFFPTRNQPKLGGTKGMTKQVPSDLYRLENLKGLLIKSISDFKDELSMTEHLVLNQGDAKRLAQQLESAIPKCHFKQMTSDARFNTLILDLSGNIELKLKFKTC
jgi:hypothetical protein